MADNVYLIQEYNGFRIVIDGGDGMFGWTIRDNRGHHQCASPDDCIPTCDEAIDEARQEIDEITKSLKP